MALPNSFGPSEIERLRAIIYDGVKTAEEIEALRLGMADTITAVAEELQIPAKLLRKTISTTHKGNYAELESDLSDLEKLLAAVGRK